MHTYTHTCIHTCVRTYIHTCMHTCIHTCIYHRHTYIHISQACIYHWHAYITHADALPLRGVVGDCAGVMDGSEFTGCKLLLPTYDVMGNRCLAGDTYIHAYMHTCIHAYMHACIHTYIHTYIHACMHACMHTCIHAYIHTYATGASQAVLTLRAAAQTTQSTGPSRICWMARTCTCMHACMHAYAYPCAREMT